MANAGRFVAEGTNRACKLAVSMVTKCLGIDCKFSDNLLLYVYACTMMLVDYTS